MSPVITEYVCWIRHESGRSPRRWAIVSAWTAADAITQAELLLRHSAHVVEEVDPYDPDTFESHGCSRWLIGEDLSLRERKPSP